MSSADEQELIYKAKNGNYEAFNCLITRYMKQTYNIAYHFVNNHEDAEDIVQETFVKVYHNLKKFRGDSEFSTWLFRIVTNISINQLNQRKRLNNIVLKSTNTDNMVNSNQLNTSNIDLMHHIEMALDKLSQLQRTVVILRHLEGLSTKQVSRILRCSEGTVKTHLFRALKKLRNLLSFLKTHEQQ